MEELTASIYTVLIFGRRGGIIQVPGDDQADVSQRLTVIQLHHYSSESVLVWYMEALTRMNQH